MIKLTKRLFIKVFYILIDIICVLLAIGLACWIREETLPFDVRMSNLFIDPVNPFRLIFLFWGLAAIFLNDMFHLYETRREIFETTEIWEVARSVLLSTMVVIVAIFLVKIESFPRSVLFLTSFSMILFFSLWRILKRVFVGYLVAQGYNNFNALIIGAGKVGISLAEEIAKRPTLGINVIGYLDDSKEVAGNKDAPKVFGKIAEFATIARREFIDKVFVTIHHDGRAFLQLLEEARELHVAVRVVPHGFELISGDFAQYNIGFIPILEYSDAKTSNRQVGKRIFDFTVALAGLMILFPAFLIIAVIIVLNSPGPVFYRSCRYGRGGRIFGMYKFRSMISNAEQILDQVRDKNEVDGPIFKIREDPRVTKVGRFLRKYSLDELPQLLNVLKGQMSLVGPRPLPIEQIHKEDLRQLKRLEVKPGITGLWQIRGRSDISFARLVKWDIWYINNWSFWLDLNILFQTIPVVIKGKGAY